MAKRGGTARGKFAMEAILQTGAGVHGKPKKAVRRADKVALQKGKWDG